MAGLENSVDSWGMRGNRGWLWGDAAGTDEARAAFLRSSNIGSRIVDEPGHESGRDIARNAKAHADEPLVRWALQNATASRTLYRFASFASTIRALGSTESRLRLHSSNPTNDSPGGGPGTKGAATSPLKRSACPRFWRRRPRRKWDANFATRRPGHGLPQGQELYW